MAPPVLILEIFFVKQISWWSNTPTLVAPFWETLEGTPVKIWSIKVEMLQATRVRDVLVVLSHSSYKIGDRF